MNIDEIRRLFPASFIIPEKKKKRPTGTPDVSSLTPMQREAFEMGSMYIEGITDQFCVSLLGYAGSGKSYLVSQLVEWALERKHNIAITAPTNKAVKISMDMAEYYHPSLEYRTIHSLLGLKEVKNELTGEIDFLQDTRNEPSITKYDVVFVDEASMISDYIFNLLIGYQNSVKIIFIGDPGQIPPVKAKRQRGITLAKPIQEAYIRSIGGTVFMLTEIIRQAKDNPIIELSVAIRENFNAQPYSHVIQTKVNEKGQGIVAIPSTDSATIRAVCDIFFNNAYYKEYGDFTKLVAWMNSDLIKMNLRIRSLIFQREDLEFFIPTDKIVTAQPIISLTDRKTILMTNNQEGTVKSITKGTYRLDDLTELPIYNMLIATKSKTGTDDQIPCYALPPSSRLIVKDRMSKLAESAKDPENASRRGMLWARFFELKDIFPDIRHDYAISCHKAQGSTYENAIVWYSNIMRNHEAAERNRILYTAVTRPKNLLFVIV